MKRLASLLLLTLAMLPLHADDQTRQLQAALKDGGFYYGTVDGELNEDTTAALRRYQIRNGLTVTGTSTAETLASLKIAGTPADATVAGPLPEKITATMPENLPSEPHPLPEALGSPHPALPDVMHQREIPVVVPSGKGTEALRAFFADTPYADAPREEQSVRLAKAQSQLRRLGYYPGAPDGLPGPGTEEGLLRFQSANHLRKTARLDEDTVAALNAVAAATVGKKPHAIASPDFDQPPVPAIKGIWVH